MYFSQCPRCGTQAYETLPEHSYCIECNYFPEDHREWDHWYGPEQTRHFSCRHFNHIPLAQVEEFKMRAAL